MAEADDRITHDALIEADERARRAALDPSRSFIVQAPAGSGKTELIIQRFLRLLAQVDKPEAIVAMTFTRKAAGEMQNRVVQALRDAERGTEVTSGHAALTRSLARAVLQRDAEREWQLLAAPGRLRIQTIDAFCIGIARQAPLSSGLGALPRFQDDASAHFVAAARAALRSTDAREAAWRTLLDHLDNDADLCVDLLARLLAKRDQWLRHVVGIDIAALRTALEEALTEEVGVELARIVPRIPAAEVPELMNLLRYAAAHLPSGSEPDLQALSALDGLPGTTADELPLWKALADWLLLRRRAAFRNKVNVNQGFPARGSPAGSDEAVARHRQNQAMNELLARFAGMPGLADVLHTARLLPTPVYDDTQWTFVQALLQVLPDVAAHLRLVFGETGEIDFTQAMLAAHEALGEPDMPSDLLLALDLRIQHLLVDEFQDTSWLQFALLHRLTSGWTSGDGRSLFVVGDPMQSIYRFRQAEVSLFLRAQREGIGSLPLEMLTLTRNFRAQAHLVEWVNTAFVDVLPREDDVARATVAFKASAASRSHGSHPAVTLELCRDHDDEARRIIARVEQSLADDSGRDVAILVRARTHLNRVLPLLRARGIAFEAIELEGLHQRQAIVDLATLTHALVQPADRLAWLACLRAPWCGLQLGDLLRVAEKAKDIAVWDVLLRADSNLALSDDGTTRLQRFVAAVAPGIAQRGRRPLATQVRSTWLALGGPAYCDATDLDAADRYFALLDRHAPGADCTDWDAFTSALEKLYAEPPPGSDVRVQVMTLHKAKGLEFDTVIIPGLARHGAKSDADLLRWRDRPPGGLLLAPLAPRSAPGREKDPLYAYLDRLANDEEDAELARLLYVGSTRACERLHLLASLEVDVPDDDTPPDWKNPPQGSALAKLWRALEPLRPAALGLSGLSPQGPQTTTAGVPLVRLTTRWSRPDAPRVVAPAGYADKGTHLRDNIAFDWARQSARHIGTVAHRLLRQLALEGLERWSLQRIDAERTRIALELTSLGMGDDERDAAVDAVSTALRNTLDDTRGRWLFDASHRDARSEYALSTWRDGAVVQGIVDRTFVDAEGLRWVIDFKLSMHEGQGLDAFLDREVERYRDQLEAYGAMLSALDPRELRLALYFPRLRAWRSWRPGEGA